MLIALGILAVTVIYFIGIYNTFQRLKTQIEASIQEIGNQLKRQASLIPNLQASVKGYLKHEKGVFKMLTDARKSATQAEKSGSMDDMDKAVQQLNAVVPRLQVAIEDNPEIKADQTVTKFMEELTDTADKLSYARRSLIDLTQAFNQKMVTFPTNLVANIFGFKKQKGLSTPQTGAHVEVSTKETKDVKVEL
ncbi:MAG: LemA family protein [Patescibacteria group bacterium]|nr:LemA family protein [Patescibacteria group bacterium]